MKNNKKETEKWRRSHQSIEFQSQPENAIRGFRVKLFLNSNIDYLLDLDRLIAGFQFCPVILVFL